MNDDVESGDVDGLSHEIIDQRVEKSRSEFTIDPSSVFPNRPLTKEDVNQFAQEFTIDYSVPYFTPLEEKSVAGGLMYEQEGIVMSSVFNQDRGWVPVEAYSRQATYKTLDDDVFWDPLLLFLAEDVDLVSSLHWNTLRAMKWPTPIPESAIHDSNHPSSINEVSRLFCSCSETTGVQGLPLPIDTKQQYSFCISCSGLWGIRLHQENVSIQTLLDPNWILEESTDGIIETTGTAGSDYALLTTAGEPFRRIERTLELLAVMCSLETRATEYDPTCHNGLLYIHKDTVAGFLFWDSVDQVQTLMQAYVTPPWRQQGLARLMLTMWINECQQNDRYYVEDPIPGMRSLFEDLDQWDPANEQNGPAIRAFFHSRHLHSPPGTVPQR